MFEINNLQGYRDKIDMDAAINLIVAHIPLTESHAAALFNFMAMALIIGNNRSPDHAFLAFLLGLHGLLDAQGCPDTANVMLDSGRCQMLGRVFMQLTGFSATDFEEFNEFFESIAERVADAEQEVGVMD